MLTVAYVFFGLFIFYGGISLQINDNLHCGGTILDKCHVVTAAHCVEGFNLGDFSIVVGRADLRSPAGARHRISAVKVHENYQFGNGWANDIALFRLVKPFVFNKFVTPAVLPQRGEDWKPGQSAVVSGFGQTDQNSPSSPILYKTQIFIESNAECQRAYFGNCIRPTNISTRNTNKITGFCWGDSGGPLHVNGKVIGVVSFSLEMGCAGPSKAPQVYTRVSVYIDWINHWRNQQS